MSNAASSDDSAHVVDHRALLDAAMSEDAAAIVEQLNKYENLDVVDDSRR